MKDEEKEGQDTSEETTEEEEASESGEEETPEEETASEESAPEPPSETAPEAPASADPGMEMAQIRAMLEQLGTKLSAMEAAASAPPPSPQQSEESEVLRQRLEADLASLPEEKANAIREIAGDDALKGMKVYSALQKAGMLNPPAATATPSDRQSLGGEAGNPKPKTFDEASARMAADMANMRL
jgi:hypothetical protein